MPQRGTTTLDLNRNVLWRHGPSWLVSMTDITVSEEESPISEACLEELKVSQLNTLHSLLNSCESNDLHK